MDGIAPSCRMPSIRHRRHDAAISSMVHTSSSVRQPPWPTASVDPHGSVPSPAAAHFRQRAWRLLAKAQHAVPTRMSPSCLDLCAYPSPLSNSTNADESRPAPLLQKAYGAGIAPRLFAAMKPQQHKNVVLVCLGTLFYLEVGPHFIRISKTTNNEL